MDAVLASAPRDKIVAKWVPIIAAYEREVEEWTKRSKRIIKRYKDERSAREKNASRFNVLWSNIETLKPALFAKTPKADVQRRFKDKDPVGRVAADVLERCLDYNLEQHAFGSTMRQGVLDYLLCGRGTAWARYVPHMRDIEMPEGSEISEDDDATGTPDTKAAAEPVQEVYYEEALPDFIHWQDFGHTEGRTWEEVTAVWRIVYLTRERLVERFGKEVGDEVPLDFTPKGMDQQSITDIGKKATVYEIWDRDTKKAIWLSKHHPTRLDERDDPLKLEKFFPCPRPLYATLANDSLIPVPDYVEYQDQADEMDALTGRIASITKSIKVAGVADASAAGLQRLLTEGVENELIAVDQWAAFAEKGGLKGSMELLPMLDIAQTLLHLYEARDRVKNDLYEITGMADIIRGATNPNETATAQKIKSNFVTMRLDERQREVQRFTRNVVEILGQIIAGHFSLETIQKMSGVKLLTQAEKQQVQQQQAMQQQAMQQQGMQQQPGMPQQAPPQQLSPDVLELMAEPAWEDVYALLQNETARCFRIDIETDSTIAGDEQEAKQDAMEFAENIGGFIEKMAAMPPGLQPVMGHMLSFMVRAFPVGKNLEGQLETVIAEMEKAAKAPPKPPQPDPTKMAEIQSKEQMHQQSLQADQASAQGAMQVARETEQMKQQAAAQQAAQSAQIEQAKAQLDAQREAHQAQLKAQLDAHTAQLDAAAKSSELEFARWKAELDAETKVIVAKISAGAKMASDAASAAAADDGEEGESEPAADPNAAVTAAVQAFTEALGTLSKPRTVIRGPDGRVTGIQ